MLSILGIIRNFKIDIDDQKILRLIGYKKRDYEVKAPIQGLIVEEKERLSQFLKPEAIYTIIDYAQTNRHPIFQGAAKVALCVCTIGPRLEQWVKKLMADGEMMRSLILDAFGSEAVEMVAAQADALLAEKARKMGLWPSKRFSPGYKKWKLDEQRFIFDILPAQDIGVRLHQESWMMTPRKSVSFRLNFYPDKSLTTRKMTGEGNHD